MTLATKGVWGGGGAMKAERVWLVLPGVWGNPCTARYF